MRVPTVTLYRGEAYIICNADDQERFLADGWQREKAPEPTKQPEAPAPEPTKQRTRKQ